MSLGNGNPKEGDKGSNFQFELMMLKSLEAISNKLSATGALSKSPASDATFTTLTGTLTQSIVKTLTVPANTFQIGNYWDVGSKDLGVVEVGVNYAGAGATSIVVYMNNVPNLTGSPIQLAGGLSASASSNFGASVFGIDPSSSAPNTITRITSNTNIQYTAAAAAPGGYTNSTIFDITKPIYIMVVVTLNDVGTTVSVGPTYIKPLKKL